MVALKVIDKAYIYHNEMMDKIQLEKNILSSFNEEKDKNTWCHSFTAIIVGNTRL